MAKILLIRHGSTEWNQKRIVQGQRDIELSDLGKRQTSRLAARLAPDPPKSIVCSDLCRARSTAAILGEALGVSVQTDRRLREISFGKWEGKSPAQIRGTWPELWRAQGRFEPGARPPGGESTEEVVFRLTEFSGDLQRLHLSAGNVAVVSHAGPLKILLCILLQLPVRFANSFVLENGSLSSIEQSATDPRSPRLIKLNDTCHIA